MEKKYILYLHTNKANEKKYVGITSTSLEQRWRNGEGYNGSKFYAAIQKYGWDNFTHKTIEENLNEFEALEKELQLIWELRTNEDAFGYNVKDWVDENSLSDDEDPIVVYDLELNILGEYPSINSAARNLGLSHAAAQDAINDRKVFTSEFILCYIGEEPPTFEEIEAEQKKRLKSLQVAFQRSSRENQGQKCCKISIETKKTVEIYDSIAEAAKKNSVSTNLVSLDCRKTLVGIQKGMISDYIYQYYPDINIPIGQTEILSGYSVSTGWLTLEFQANVRKFRVSKEDIDETLFKYWIDNQTPIKLYQDTPGRLICIDDTGYILKM